MLTLIFFFVSLITSVIAVKLSATKLKVGKHDWLSSVIGVVLSLVVLTTVGHLVPMQVVGLVVSILLVGFVLESILETTFTNGMIIAAAAIIVQWLIKFGFTKLGFNTDMLLFIQQLLTSLK